jgi:hypothetical protein
MSQHRTNRGREFNMQAFASAKGESVAVGNSNRNARGDLLGPGGKVIATRQQITTELYNQRSSKPNTTTVKLNPMEQEISRKDIVGADGIPRWEITYADGSVEIQDKLETKIETRVDIDSRVENKGDL